MSISALPNGRDLGSHRTASGLVVGAGRVFRSGAPVDEDHARALELLGVRTVMDLRTDPERENRPLLLPEGTSVLLADILAEEPEDGPASLGRIARAAVSGGAGDLSAAEMRETFRRGYRSFVTLPGARRRSGEVLTALADPGTGPALIQCTAGKDRTGWISALVLLALGVDADDVMSDYLASGPAVARLFAPLREMVAERGGNVDTLDLALAVLPEYLDESLQTMVAEYGSLQRYLTDGLGLAPGFTDLLQRRLLVAAPTAESQGPRTLEG